LQHFVARDFLFVCCECIAQLRGFPFLYVAMYNYVK